MARKKHAGSGRRAGDYPEVRLYDLDGPNGPYVKDTRIGLVTRDVRGVLDGGPALTHLNRTYTLVAAVGERIIRDLREQGTGF